MNIKIYTDGSSRGNGTDHSIGAWGYIILIDDKIWAKECGIEYGVTNQQMELEACIRACKKVDPIVIPLSQVDVISDSAYVCNCANQKWFNKWERNGWINAGNKKVANKDRWEKLIPFFKKIEYSFVKTKGHSDDKWNCLVDQMVQEATSKEKAANVGNNYTSF